MKNHEKNSDQENGVDKSVSERSAHEESRRKLMKRLASCAFAAPAALITLSVKAGPPS
jgi:hypothetical protein